MLASLFAMAKRIPTTCTAFYRPMRGYTVADQRKVVHAWASKHGVKIVAEYEAGEHGDDLNEWRRTTRANEGAVVADLWSIAEPRSEKVRPLASYSATIAALTASCAGVIEARTGITSRDGEKWREAVQNGANKVASGREMPRARAQRMARKRWAKAPAGVVEHWGSPNMKGERDRWAQHWRDTKFASAEAAFDALPEEMQQEFGSTRTAYRVFGPRHGGAKGGRPRKPAAKRRKV